MWQDSVHPSDQDLLLWADGEYPPQRAAELRRHLSACWTCRARMADLERTIADFVHLYHSEFDAKVSPIDGPRALLKARLAECAPSSHMRRLPFAAAIAGLMLLTALAVGISRNRDLLSDANRTYNLTDVRVFPNEDLTPGATVRSTVRDVCSATVSTNDPYVPDPLKREVLREYGLTNVSANAYEIDYLVTPQLGGAANIRNLWPEPSLNTVWNARVKDALEDRLHYLVCSGQVDLATAQHEISHDWVAAYKKYFRTNEPLQRKSRALPIGVRMVLAKWLVRLP
jgi:hypothetical protein